MKTSQLAICTVATGMLLSTSFATPVQWTIEEGGNGHWYEGVRIGYYPDGPGATWEWCKEQA
ncbi:MAG: hypothetical protein HOC27_05600, partial [Phycisphaerae bacterium]|nr:hypothetical protein [Phycisphaerae bacterium]